MIGRTSMFPAGHAAARRRATSRSGASMT
jgi:hypothetical protein